MSSSKQRSLFDSDGSSEVVAAEVSSKSPRLFLKGDQQRLVIRASAGTGKTFQLANRYLTLLRSSTADKILASTFTRKAAGEITDRILLRLAKAALDEKEFESLGSLTGTPQLTQDECLALTKEFTSQLHRIRISTLDGFFARLAGSFALELRLPPGWRLMDEIEASHLQDQAIDQVLREGDLQELKTLMHQLDKGSVRRSVHQLISEHISSFHEIFLHTEKSAWSPFGTIQMPTNEQLQFAVDDLAALQIENSRMLKARNDDLERLQNEEWESLYSKGLLPKVLGDGKYYKKEIPGEVQQQYRRLEKLIRAKFLAPWAHQTAATYQLLEQYDAIFEQLKHETSGLRFDDVTRRLAQSLTNRTTSELSHRLDGSIDHVLLDEFQDTSVTQWNVIRPFAEDTTTDNKKSFFCVGDGKQAIYSWRGGEASIFDTISKQLQGVREEPLNKSFRSSQVVIDVVNKIFKGMVAHDGFDDDFAAVQSWSQDFPLHETARTEFSGYFRLCTSPIPHGMEIGSRDQRWLIEESNRFVANMIQQQSKAHPRGTIGVLTRSNQRISEIIFELNRLGIDASEEGGNPLTDSAGVLLLLALFQLADHPGDTIARFHIAQSPLAPLVQFPDKDDDLAIHLFALSLRKQLLRHGYGEVVNGLLKKLAPHCSKRELRRLTQLAGLADDFDSISQTLRTTEFIEFVEKQRVLEPTDSRVRVMTIHQSKGLQFDTVIYAECDGALTHTPSFLSFTQSPGEAPDAVALYRSKDFRELFPRKLQQALDQTNEKQITEALCLLYVALTRAVHSLIVIALPRTAKGAEKKLPKTSAGIIRAALAPTVELESNTTLYEEGNPKWYEDGPAQETSAVAKGAPEPLQLSIRFKESIKSRRLPRVAPSQKEQSHSVRLESLLETGDSTAMTRGTLFHAWMEQVTWLEDGMPLEETLRAIGVHHGIKRDQINHWLTDFEKMSQRPSVKNALSRASYKAAGSFGFSPELTDKLKSGNVQLKVFNERRFAVNIDGRIVSGSLDRLVTISQNGELLAADIIDHKTDSLPNDIMARDERVELYRGQLKSYRTAAAIFLGIPEKHISARLLFLSSGQIVNVK